MQARRNSRRPLRSFQSLGATEELARTAKDHANSHDCLCTTKQQDCSAKSPAAARTSGAYSGLRADLAKETSDYGSQAADTQTFASVPERTRA